MQFYSIVYSKTWYVYCCVHVLSTIKGYYDKITNIYN